MMLQQQSDTKTPVALQQLYMCGGLNPSSGMTEKSCIPVPGLGSCLTDVVRILVQHIWNPSGWRALLVLKVMSWEI